MNKLYVMMGCPGSGKTTYAQEMIRQDKNIKWVSRDEIRFQLVKKGEPYFSKEKDAFKAFTNTINYYLDNDWDVIADATHLNQKSRDKLFNNLRINKSKTKVIGIVMRTPLDECLKRNLNRLGTRAFVPDDDLCSMYENFTMPTYKEHYGIFNEIRIVETEV